MRTPLHSRQMSREAAPFQLVLRARELRKQQTPAEQAMWELLRHRRWLGLKFRRQVPLHGYIADFFCEPRRLVIEIDGGVHGTTSQQSRDENRDADLAAHGYTVVRFTNRQVLEAPESVLSSLERRIRR